MQKAINQGLNDTIEIKENSMNILTNIEIRNHEEYANAMYTYQRLINNLIGAIGIIKGPDIYYPYLDRDKTGNIYINSKDKFLTGIDIKTIDITSVRAKIKDFTQNITDPKTKATLYTLTEQVERRILQYFQKQQQKEVEQNNRHDTNVRFFESTKEQKGKRAIEALYNLLGEKRMQYFDYDTNTHQCQLNTQGKERLLNELYKEIDDITKYRFTNIEDVFPGSDYPQIKNKSITAEQITNEDIIVIAEYLLAAHHSIDDMTELYSKINEKKNINIHISKPIKDLLKIGLKALLDWTSSTTTITEVVDRHSSKAKSSKLKRNRGHFLERIIIASPYLQNLYDFDAIEKVYNTCILSLQEELKKQFPGVIKHVKPRLKSGFSCKNKLLRDKSITSFRDIIGVQIFIDSAHTNRNTVIEQIFRYINQYIHNHTVQDSTIHIQKIDIDNKKIVNEEEYQELVTSLNNNVDYPIEKRAKKTQPKAIAQDDSQPVLNFFNKGKTGSNGKRQDIKEIIIYHIQHPDQSTTKNLSGIEIQIMPHGESINSNEAAHEFLDTQKTIDLVINTNAVCPREEYCRIKDVAITARANYLHNVKRKLKDKKSSEYTQNMRDEERFYVIDIDDRNREFINKIDSKNDPQNTIEIKEGKVYIDLINLEEISSSIYKRHAADIIIMHQANNELQTGKIIQYQYHDDIQRSHKLHEYININIQDDNIHEGRYPWIHDIQRNERGEVINTDIHFINPGSRIRIQTGQTPKNATIIVPDDDGEKGYAQNISGLSYDLKTQNIKENTTTQQILSVMGKQKN